MLSRLFRFFSKGKGSTRAVLILGMHRSGTSSLAGSLEQRGLCLGKVRTSNPYNQKGNRENGAVVKLNEQVLAESGGAWDSPPGKISWNQGLERERDRLIVSLSRSRAELWAFKDPRTLVTLPFWEQGLADYRAVGTFRHPLAVAQSLNARQGMAIEKGLKLWCDYNSRLLELCRRKPFPLVCFDASPSDYVMSVDRIATELGLVRPVVNECFFEESLRHQGVDSDDLPMPDVCRKIYQQLQSIFRRMCEETGGHSPGMAAGKDEV